MRYNGPLIVVEDMERSRKFYEELLNQRVILDFGANIAFDGGFSLQTKESWSKFIGIGEDGILFRPNNFELYFEEEQFDQFLEKLSGFDVELIHDAREYSWGQSVIRFYDPDKHIIEVGESMAGVARRFSRQGMSVEEIAERTQHPPEFVRAALEAETSSGF